MIYRLHAFSAFILLIAACHTTKKTVQEKNKEVTIQLDTISVVPQGSKSTKDYRAANTRLNDIIHTRLDVDFDWKLSRMNGKATLIVKPYFYSTNVLYLDARGMDIKKVEVLDNRSDASYILPADQTSSQSSENENILFFNNNAAYVYERDSLKINLKRKISSKETYTVIIEYVAKPNELKAGGGSAAIVDDKGLYFINPSGENPFKMPQIWTQGETQASSVWFPTIDSPNEKMTQEIFMTVEDKYLTLSNGTLFASVKKPGGLRTDHWKLDQPHSPYLAMMAVGEFKKVTDTPWNGKEISYYVEAPYEEYAKAIFGDTKEMIEFYSSKLGVAYPWPKYAQIVARDYVSGAMENTSATLHGDFMVYQTAREMIDGKKGNAVIAHELFHQWFGDYVTAESWSNLPLNESFATYGEYLWDEYKSGRETADYHHWASKQGYLNSSKEVDLIRFEYKDKEDMFDAFSYNKGGQILHMLRKAVGDEAFFASLKNYLETNKYKSAEVHNLRLAFEETTGQDLNWFFNQWFLAKGRPKLDVKVEKIEKDGNLKMTVEQTQDLKTFPLYTLPVKVDVYSNGGLKRTSILITQQKQEFILPSGGSQQLVNFDAERQLLADVNYPKSTSEYIFQYNHAPLFEDRMEALKALEPKLNEDAVMEVFSSAIQNDKFFAIKNFAIPKLEKVSAERKDKVKEILINVFFTEKNTVVRAKALETLNKMFPASPEMEGMNVNALKEQSYAICGEALEALSKSNPKLAVEKASLFERESGKDVIFPIANLYALHGGDYQIQFFHSALRYINGFDLMTFIASYSKTARRCTIPSNVISAAKDIEVLGKGANKYIKYSSVKGIQDILSTWESKENTARVKLETAKKQSGSTTELEKELATAQETKKVLEDIYNRVK